jgi:hypothetical protein
MPCVPLVQAPQTANKNPMKTIHFVSELKLNIKVSLINTTNIKDGKISIKHAYAFTSDPDQ